VPRYLREVTEAAATIDSAYVYRLYNAKHERLYVGVSTDPLRRLREHQTEKTWAEECVLMLGEKYEDFDTARAAEVAAIAAEPSSQRERELADRESVSDYVSMPAQQRHWG
jgi:predicted GIY-YIG superfamily endonuclease